MKCPCCGQKYDDFRTGFTFKDVRRMMYVHDPNPATWRYKRRRSVLGFWRSLKLQFWHQVHGECE